MEKNLNENSNNDEIEKIAKGMIADKDLLHSVKDVIVFLKDVFSGVDVDKC